MRRPSERKTANLCAYMVVPLALTGMLAIGVSASATPAVSLRVEPDTHLVPGQWATARWTGVDAGTLVSVRQCTDNPVTVRDCAYLGREAVHTAFASASGSGSVSFPILGVVNGGSAADRFECDVDHPCSIALFADAAGTDIADAVVEPLHFSPSVEACPAPSSKDVVVSGQGTYSFARAYTSWEGRLCRAPRDVHVRYRGTSSASGEAAFVDGRTAFAATTRPLAASSVADLRSQGRTFAYAPMIGSGLAFGFRMTDPSTGQPITSLRLTPDQLAAIFTGQLTDLAGDPEVVDQNPGVTFPPVVRAIGRADPSPQTRLLTSWFLAVARQTYRDGGNVFDGGPTDTYPTSGAITLLSSAPAEARAVAAPNTDPSEVGTIGWMDSSIAALSGLPTVLVENRSGAFVGPTPSAISAAIGHMSVNADGVTRTARFFTHDAKAYPLPLITYLVVQTNATADFDDAQANVIRPFIRFAAHVSDRRGGSASQLPQGYAPLPTALTAAAERAAARLPTAPYVAPGAGTGTGAGATGGSGGGWFGGTGGGGFEYGSGFGGGFEGGGGFGGNGGYGGGSQGGTGGGQPGDGTPGVPGASPSPTAQPVIVIAPGTSLTSAGSRYAWPAVLVGGVVLLILGMLLSVALGFAQRRGERQAMAAAADGDAPAQPRERTGVR
jgi:ABC-type phosphate transport system substrate-binding protein